jgi:hypothetical protein
MSVRSARVHHLSALISVVAFLLAIPAVALASPTPVNGSGLAAAPASSQSVARALSAMTGLQPAQVEAKDACATPAPGRVACLAQLLVTTSGAIVHPRLPPARPAPQTTAAAAPATEPPGEPAPEPGTPTFLQQAYDLSSLSATAGGGDTVAIVDAYDDPSAEADLGAYRSYFGLPACTTANGCFQKVDQSGGTNYPTADEGWDVEISLDLDAVSALCPNCHILLVETNSNSYSDLDAGIEEADALGAQQISNSWGGTGADPYGTYTFTGVDTLAATGDNGYLGVGENQFPAALPDMTAVGGTSLTQASNPRGFAESAWSYDPSTGGGGGSGCDTTETKPAWQSDSGCSGRSYADLSADADPDTGLQIYDSQPDSWDPSGGWQVVGGTSEATPLTAAFEALTGVDGATPQWAYTDSGLLNDVVSGSTGTCPAAYPYICQARPGYDGPTGNGSISGTVTTGGPGIGGAYALHTYANSALLAGGVYPNGLDTTYWWEYGTDTSYGQTTGSQDIGSEATLASVQDIVPSLQPGTTYHLRLVAHNADGTAYGNDFTLTTASGTDSPPTSTVAPTVGGSAEEGVQLTAGPGTWSSVGTLTYQWQEAQAATGPWAGLPGATGSTYTPAAADFGAYLRVVVTDETADGAASAASSAAGPVVVGTPANTSAPTVTDASSGIATDGDTLTATPGSWGPTGDTVTYAWQRSGDGGNSWANITGATESAYTLTDADVSDEVRVKVTESNTAGNGSADSNAVGPVAGPPAPTNVAAPNIVWWGPLGLGTTLSTTAGYWNPAGVSVTYAWQRSGDGTNWQTIAGADWATYTLSAADVGSYVRVLVTESNPSGSTAAASTADGPVPAPTSTPVVTPAPILTPAPPASTPGLTAPAHPASTPSAPARLAASAGTLTTSRPVKLTFNAPANATVRVTITQLVHGRLRVVGARTLKAARSGHTAVTVSRRFAGHLLAPGSYRVSVQTVRGAVASPAATIKLAVH